MENTARLYHCARCHRQVVICRHCDRGNIYCAQGCAEAARKEGLRAAGRRYQRSRQGRLRHAERQRRYRARRQKVTHQGSLSSSPDDPLVTGPERPTGDRPTGPGLANDLCCHFCRRECGLFLRHDFLHRAPPAARSGIFSLPQAPMEGGSCPASSGAGDPEAYP